MLFFSTHKRFAHKLNPEREARLLWVNGKKNEKGNEQGEGPETGGAAGEGILPITGGYSSRINSGILAGEKLETVLRHPSGLIALLESDHEDLRSGVEAQMRKTEPDSHKDPGSAREIPMHEIVAYLRRNESEGDALRQAALNRLRDPEALLRFTHNLGAQVQKLKDIESTLTGSGLRLGSMDAARVHETEQWLKTQCAEHGLSIEQPTLTDWLAGRYEGFAPEKSEALRVVHYISGRTESLPDAVSIDTTGAPDAEKLKARLEERIRAKNRGNDNDPRAVVEETTGTLTRSHWVQRVRSGMQALRKRKLFHLFLGSGGNGNEDAFSGMPLSEQITLLSSELTEARRILLEEVKLRARVVRDRLQKKITDDFTSVDGDSALTRFGQSQTQLARVVADAVQPLEQIIFNPPAPDSPGFERYIEDAYGTVESLANRDVLGDGVEAGKRRHMDTIAWATHLRESGKLERGIEALRDEADSPALRQLTPEARKLLQDLLPRLERIARGEGAGEDFDFVEQDLSGLRGRQYVTLLLHTVSNRGFRNRLERAGQEFDARRVENTADERDRVRERYETVKEGFGQNPELLSHTVCKVLHIEDGLREHYTKVRLNLAAADEHGEEAVGSEYLKTALDTVERLEDAQRQMQGIGGSITYAETEAEFLEAGAGTAQAAACYNRDTGRIVLNMTRIRERGLNVDEQIHHERGHAIIDILTRRTGLFEGLLIKTSELLDERIPTGQLSGPERTFRELLRRQARKWKVEEQYDTMLERARGQTSNEREAEELAEELYEDFLMDELLNQHATWVERGRPADSADPEQIALFRHIENTLEPEEAEKLDAKALEEGRLEKGENSEVGKALVAYNVGDEEEDENAPDGGETAGILDINTDLIELRRKIEKVRSFYESYTEYKGQLAPLYGDYDEAHRLIQQKFHSKQSSAQNAKKAIGIVEKHVAPLLKEIDVIRSKKSNVSDAEATGQKGWKALFGHIGFVSIMDIWKTMKQAGEDIKRMWDRRGAAKQASLGRALTDWIPKNVPYAGRLQDEFYRRDKESEQKEVNEWKEKLGEFDSYDLIAMLRGIRNRDQAKAIFILLTERGRMDWNDQGVWETLNAFSNYSMPIEACARNDVLRDKWIQKLVADIWGDKDLYTGWRQNNDGAVKSGKDKFTATVDQLSNVGDGMGMGEELRHQLGLYQQWKDTGQTSAELNPHLYEEILDYAMRNGKMSMEDKLFYLVKGVDVGVLSIDRLRTMAGETSGILNRYPWLDYFYKKNNSLPEVKALARRLEEPGDPMNPGPKTTMWLHLEVQRLESTRQRISKAISGTRAENLDHEDVPTLVAQADWVNIDRMTGMVSGTREKLSPEAIRNAYTGFGTKFKVLAQLARLERDGKAVFTDKDLDEAAKSIVAYIHMDNIFTRNANAGDRPQLTWNVIDTQQGPSTHGLTVGNFRTPQNAFVSKVLQDVDSGFWSGLGVTKVTRENLIRTEDPEHRISDRTDYDKKNMEDRYEEATKKVFNKLQDYLSKRPELIKQKLMDFADAFREENYANPPGTRPEKDYISYKNMEDYFSSRLASAV